MWGARELERAVNFQGARDTLPSWFSSWRDTEIVNKRLSHLWDACSPEIDTSCWAWKHLRKFPQLLLISYPVLNISSLSRTTLWISNMTVCFLSVLFLQFCFIAFEHITQNGKDSFNILFSLLKLLENLLPASFFSWLSRPQAPSRLLLPSFSSWDQTCCPLCIFSMVSPESVWWRVVW